MHLFPIPRECAREIFIGANASDELRAHILDAVVCCPLNVDVYEAYINAKKYEINFRPIEVRQDYRQW